ncbi:MAG: glycosyltransferase family 4 protein [Nitrospirales bacterium]
MIGIDATGWWGETHGIHVYARQLAENLLALYGDSQAFRVYCRREIPREFSQYTHNNEFPTAQFSDRKICEQFWLSYQLLTRKDDLFHATYGKPLYCPSKLVITVHDLFLMRFPEKYSSVWKAYHRIAVEHGAQKADLIHTPSEFTKQDIIELLGISEDRVQVIPHAVDKNRFQPATTERQQAVISRYKLPKRFILHVGGFSPVKNTVRIVKAFHQLLNESTHEDLGMVFAGGTGGSQYKATVEAVIKYKLEGRITFTGYIPDDDVVALYTAAQCVMLPSLMEGFGLPLLESFSCGTPVICSDRGSLPEVAGKGAILIPAQDSEAMADAMNNVLSDEHLRTELIQHAVLQAQKFSLRRTAQETYQSYKLLTNSA